MGLHEKTKQKIQWTRAWNGALHAWKTRFVVLVFFEIWMYPAYRTHRLEAYIINWAATQCGILTSVDSDEPVQPPFKLTNSKRCSVSSLTLIEYSSDLQRLWSDCAYSQADLKLCWLLEISCHGSIIFFRGIGRKVGRSLTWLILGILFAPDLIWQDVGDLLGPNYLQTLNAGGRERERERERD